MPLHLHGLRGLRSPTFILFVERSLPLMRFLCAFTIYLNCSVHAPNYFHLHTTSQRLPAINDLLLFSRLMVSLCSSPEGEGRAGSRYPSGPWANVRCGALPQNILSRGLGGGPSRQIIVRDLHGIFQGTPKRLSVIFILAYRNKTLFCLISCLFW